VRFDHFQQGLREQGYIEGRNVAFEHSYAREKYELLPDPAAELPTNRNLDAGTSLRGGVVLQECRILLRSASLDVGRQSLDVMPISTGDEVAV